MVSKIVNAVPLLALLLASVANAFMTPINSYRGSLLPRPKQHSSAATAQLSSSWSSPTLPNTRSSPTPRGPVTQPSSTAVATTVALEMATDADNRGAAAEPPSVEETAAKLRETAAAFRAEVAELESKRQRERREGADRAFAAFDTNKDGSVDMQELQAGLEGPLRRSFIKQLTTRMGRKPTPDEIEARIAELPGGSLFPDDLARKLIAMYDENRDGVLQLSEFAPTEELRSRLEGMFREQREQELEARKAEMERGMMEKTAAKGGVGSGAERARVALRRQGGGVNNGAATASDRALSALAYVLPLGDAGLENAGHLFATHPNQMAPFHPLAAVAQAFQSLPFASLILVFGLVAYFLVSSNMKTNKLVRFNMKQAIIFDIAVAAIDYLGELCYATLGKDAYKLEPFADVGSDVVFVTLLVAITYSVGYSAFGKFPNNISFLARFNSENPYQEEDL